MVALNENDIFYLFLKILLQQLLLKYLYSKLLLGVKVLNLLDVWMGAKTLYSKDTFRTWIYFF
jgi:hypothetical protein